MTMKRILGVMALASMAVLAGCGDAGDGEKNGVVTRVVKNSGWICPTNEVEIIRGGLINGSGVLGGPFHATVEDPQVMAVIEKAWKEQKEVTVTYQHERASWCRSDSDSTFIKTASVVVSEPAPAVVSDVAPTGLAGETRDQKITRLLAVQAQLIQELAKK